MVGLNMDRRDQKAISALITEKSHIEKVRRTGSAAIDSVYVASGTYDAYIDVGGALTGESFLPSASIVLEAGGIVSDQEGKALRPITNLLEKYSVIMAATKELHQEIIDRIKK
jgi:myo-inositol-1(or 4)-monophosphatase